MKHTETNDDSQKTFEIGETDLMNKKVVLPPVADYLSTLEKSYGDNKTTQEQTKSFNKSLASYSKLSGSEITFWSEKTGLPYTFWDRLKRTKELYDLRNFNWLDFSPTYLSIKGFEMIRTRPDSKTKYQGKTVYYFKEDFENLNDLIDSYGVREGLEFNRLLITNNKQNIYRKQTYFERLRNLLKKLIQTFKWTPPHIEQYNKNKDRINWFRNNVWKHFFSYGKEADEASQKLKEMGYNVFPDHVYYDHSPSLRRE